MNDDADNKSPPNDLYTRQVPVFPMRPHVFRIICGENHTLVLNMMHTTDLARLALFDHPDWPAQYHLHGVGEIVGHADLATYYKGCDTLAARQARQVVERKSRRSRWQKEAAFVVSVIDAAPEGALNAHTASLAVQASHPEWFKGAKVDASRGGVITPLEREVKRQLAERQKIVGREPKRPSNPKDRKPKV